MLNVYTECAFHGSLNIILPPDKDAEYYMDEWDDFFILTQEIGDDNQLVHTTHTCPHTGEDCLPTCAYAVVPREKERDKEMWVCGQVIAMIGDNWDAYSPQGVQWKY